VDEKRHLLRFIESSQAFDNNSKLKALLFVAGVKPNTFVHVRIQKNIHDKHEFERLLKLNNIAFSASKAKGFEEISSIRGNAVVWKLRGTWYGYDLFRNEKEKKKFARYVSLVKQQKHDQADKLAGSIYGYPACCVKKFIAEHDQRQLPKKYSYYQYYKRLHDSDVAFPFISHMPCRVDCSKTKALNRKYAAAIKKWAPKFHQEYAKKRTYKMQVIVDLESGTDVWKKKNGHDYSLIAKKPVEKKHYLISWLTKAAFKRGVVLDATVSLRYDYATVRVNKKTGMLKNFHHERKFTTP